MRILKNSLARIVTATALTAATVGLIGSPAQAFPPVTPKIVSPAGPSSTGSTPTGTQCGAPVGTPGSITALSFGKRDWPLTGGLHMDTSNGRVDRNTGTVDATVHLYNSYWGMGYTGSVLMVLRDNCGGMIGVTKPGQWGVDAKAWFWNTNERRVHYTASVDKRIANRVASVEVIHNRETGGEAIKLYRQAREKACEKLPSIITDLVGCPIPELR